MRWLSILVLLSFITPAHSDGVFAFGVPAYGFPSSTVVTLPTCTSALNTRIYTVTDALLPSLAGIVAGGGAVVVLVHCNGTNWIVG